LSRISPREVCAGIFAAGLVAGGHYKVYVSAANEGAESRLSEPVTAIVAGEQEQAA